MNAPVGVTRYLLSAGERIEILANCTGQNGTTVDLKAYNSVLSGFIPGGENFPTGPFANALGKIDFTLLHLIIGTATASPITSIPATLTVNTFPAEASADLIRIITLSDSSGVPGTLGPSAFILGYKLFDIDYTNYEVPLNNTEIWELNSSSVFAHPFHIHDVQFYVLTRNGSSPPSYEQGWKDVVLVESGEIVRFIAKFEDYADTLHPFMYHCHIILHEDEGMMGQFIVTDNLTGIAEEVINDFSFLVFPNPSSDKIYFSFSDSGRGIEAYYITVLDALGRTVLMLPRPQLRKGIEISFLENGTYTVLLTEEDTKITKSAKFIKQ
ncbi:MAG TPA: multicopper oxidase domain-containing protein [Flavobacteriales bacterium]|nr:multicopper oxidase domain-containing protein [Flavobacteriales bacterium]